MEQNNGRMVGLAHIGIMTADMEKSVAFYRDILGFELTYQADLNGTKLAFLNVGSCIVELVSPKAPITDKTGMIDHIAIEVQEIEKVVEELKAKGAPITGEISFVPDLYEGVKNIFFTGPSGERIELFQYRKLDG